MSPVTRSPEQCRVLVLHDDPDSYFESLVRRFPALRIELCRDAEAVKRLSFEPYPNIVFSWKSAKIAPDIQREIIMNPQVEWVQIGGAGFDHLLPLDGLQASFTNCTGVLSSFLAETVLAAILMMNFRFPAYIHQQRAQEWKKLRWRSVTEKTLLLIGLGNIGGKVAQQAKAMGMKVLGIRSNPNPVPGVDEMSPLARLHEVLPLADFVSLHIPLTKTTRHLIGAEELSQMRPDAILINTARGAVVDERALIKALQEQQIAGAYLDVFEKEPLPVDNPLWNLPNVVISPHVSDSVADWEARFANFFAQNLERWLKGEVLLNLVDLKKGY